MYGRTLGSVAAPSAGPHSTPAPLATIAARGVARSELALPVKAGASRPLEVHGPAHPAMHDEWYELPTGTAAMSNAARGRGGRVWAVGTTTLRAL